ncbi:hypothetical protein [Leucobacter sp.]
MLDFFWLVRSFFQLFSVEIPLTLGAVFFALSWIRPRIIAPLPPSGRRARPLTWLGIAGALAVLAVGTATGWLATRDPIAASGDAWTRAGGWWQRPAPLIAVALVAIFALIALRREPLPAPGERTIAPRRRWWAFAPRTPLWIAVIVGALLLLTTAWQTLIGVSLPEGANRYGIGPENSGLPEFMPMQEGMGYVWGAGWPNHLPTLIALALAAAALLLALGSDANRPVFARASASQVREERTATARTIVLIALGGALLTLGAVWAHTGFIGTIIVGVYEDDGQQGEAARFIVGTGYRDIAGIMHLGGYVVQGLGAALLLRLAVDTWRARRALRRMRRADGPDPAAVLAGAEGTR